MAELEEDVVLVGADTAAVTDLHGHGSGDDVTRGKILGGRSVTLHEAFTLRVEKVTTLTTSTLGDQAASAVDTGRVELDKLEILVGETSTGNHGHTVTSASVSRRAAEVGTSVATGGEDGVVGEESVESAVLLVVGEDTTALAVLHNQVKGEVLDEVVGVVAQRLAVQGVQKGVAGSVGGGAASVGLATLAILLRLTTESSLVAVRRPVSDAARQLGLGLGVDQNLHLAFLGTGKGAAVVLELDNGGGSLAGHVVNGVLVTEPVGALDGIVHVPSPVVLVHVAERGVDATLGGDGVGSGREELGDASRVEAGLSQTEGGTEARATGAYDEGIVFVVLCDEKARGVSREEPGQRDEESQSRVVRDTYDDGVLVANERRRLLCAQRSIGDDAGCLYRIVSKCVCRGGHVVGVGVVVASFNLPTGRVVEKVLACLSEN